MPSEVMVLGAVQMAQGAKFRVPCDWGDMPVLKRSYIEGLGYTIAAYDIVAEGTGAPVVSGKQIDYTVSGVAYQTSALLTADSAGSFQVTFSITLDDPDASEYTAVGIVQVLEAP